jgi:hypothetical protein
MHALKGFSVAATVAVVFAVSSAGAGTVAPAVAPGSVDVDGWITLAGLDPSAGAPVVTLRSVAGGATERLRLQSAGTPGSYSAQVRADSGVYDVLIRSGKAAPVSIGHLTVLPPRIEWLSPTTGRASGDTSVDSFVAVGRNFGRRRGRVFVDGSAARIVKWRSGAVRFRAKRPAAGPHDVEVRASTDACVAPCGLLVAGGASVGMDRADLFAPGAGGGNPSQTPVHDVWRLDWRPGQAGQSSSHMTQGWTGSTFVYDPDEETLLFETRFDPKLAVGGMYVMLSQGGWTPETPDVTAEIFFDLTRPDRPISTFAYKSRAVGDRTGDGWTDDPSKPSDLIESSLADPSFVIATEDRIGDDGLRTCGFLIGVHDVNRHRPMYGRTDGSAWTGLRFGGDPGAAASGFEDDPNVGAWSYLYASPKSQYDEAGRLTSWIVPTWATYPGEDGPDFHALPVPSDSIESELLGSASAPQAPRLVETFTTGGGAVVVQRGTAGSDVLTGSNEADAIRAGTGHDSVYAGSGDDLVFVDGASANSFVDAGALGTDVLDVRQDPMAASDAVEHPASWGMTLVLDALTDGSQRTVTVVSPSEVDVGPDASGHVEFPGGARVEFRGIERLRF